MGYNTIFEHKFVLTFQGNMLPPVLGSLHLIQVDANVSGRRKCVGYLARFQVLRQITVTEKGRHDVTWPWPISIPSSLSLTVWSGVAYHQFFLSFFLSFLFASYTSLQNDNGHVKRDITVNFTTWN
jgi:hypothetical protein